MRTEPNGEVLGELERAHPALPEAGSEGLAGKGRIQDLSEGG